MQLGIGAMGIPPRAFWGYSLAEWLCAAEGYRLANGGERATTPLSHDELAEMMEEYPDELA